MKLVIQIPCHNEEETLPEVLADLPRSLPGIETIEWLVIDDGSTDRTSDVAWAHGANHVIRLPSRLGLANAFLAGLEAAIVAGADIIVNTDGDHQYRGEDIPALVAPIVAKRADIVVGARPVATNPGFSLSKKLLQRLGTHVTRVLSGTDVQDSPSGFRAFTRDAAMRLHVYNRYTYTVETIIQAGRKGMVVQSVPIKTNPVARPSRLVRGTTAYIARQFLTMLRVYVTYRPFRFFAVTGTAVFLVGLLLGLRFLIPYLRGEGSGHVQSLILAALLLGTGFFLVVIGLLADLLAVNRTLLEGLDWRVRRMEASARAGDATRQGEDSASALATGHRFE